MHMRQVKTTLVQEMYLYIICIYCVVVLEALYVVVIDVTGIIRKYLWRLHMLF